MYVCIYVALSFTYILSVFFSALDDYAESQAQLNPGLTRKRTRRDGEG